MKKELVKAYSEHEDEIIAASFAFLSAIAISYISFKAGSKYAMWRDESVATGYFQDLNNPSSTALVVYKRKNSPEILFRQKKKD